MTLAPPEVREAKRIIREDAKLRKAERPRNEGAPKLDGEPGEATPRLPMTRNRRGRIIARQAHVCAGCGEKVSVFEIDHVTPLELGGADDDDNLQALCGRCHRAKTNTDLGRIAKARRQAKLMQPRVPSKHPIRSGGFR